MLKKIIKKMFIVVLFGVGIGYGFGRFYFYFYLMVVLEGYWEFNYDLEYVIGFYYVYL